MSAEEACASLIEALDAKRTDIVKTLLDHIAKSETGPGLKLVLERGCTRHGTILHYAVRNSLNDATRALLLAGADPGVRDEAGQTVLDIVDNPAMLQLFSDELLRAVAASELARITELLEAGVRRDVSDSVHTGNTALHWAASFGTQEVVRLLVTNSFDVNAVNTDGCSPLHDAVQRKDENIVKILLEAGANVNNVATHGKLKGKSPKDMALTSDQLKHLFPGESDSSAVISVNGDHGTNESVSHSYVPFKAAIVSEHVPNKNMSVINKPLKNNKLNFLWPRPKHIYEMDDQGVSLPPHLQLAVSHPDPRHGVRVHDLLDVWQVYTKDVNAAGHSISIKAVQSSGHLNAAGPGDIEVSLSGNMASEEYSLAITTSRTRILAGGLSGLHFSCQTLLQLLWLFKAGPVPQVVIRDKPSLAVRGVLLDLAGYGRLPTMDTLTGAVRSLARLKMTELHLFIRLTPQQDWQLPFLPHDLISLDRECHDRRVRVYPTLDILQPCGLQDLQAYRSAFSSIVSCFGSRDKLHLGPCLSSVILSAADQSGPGDVFSSLPGLLPTGPDTSLVLCSNSLISNPGLIDNIPSNVTLIEYGFQGDYPFMDNLQTLSRSGCDQLVCVGTSSWGCLVGRPANMVQNILEGVAASDLCSASGVLLASWAASPALAPLASALPGWTFGLGAAWNNTVTEDEANKHLGDILTHHIFCDQTGSSGQVLLELGNSEASVELPRHGSGSANILGSSVLLSVVMRPDTVDLEATTTDQLGRVVQEVRRSLARLQASREGGGGVGEGLIQEIATAGELLLLAARWVHYYNVI